MLTPWNPNCANSYWWHRSPNARGGLASALAGDHQWAGDAGRGRAPRFLFLQRDRRRPELVSLSTKCSPTLLHRRCPNVAGRTGWRNCTAGHRPGLPRTATCTKLPTMHWPQAILRAPSTSSWWKNEPAGEIKMTTSTVQKLPTSMVALTGPAPTRHRVGRTFCCNGRRRPPVP